MIDRERKIVVEAISSRWPALKSGYSKTVIITILALLGVRLGCAALTPLSSDEGLYWVLSKHLAGGYLEHPPMNPILIRVGTTFFGDTEFGIRSIGVLLGLPTSWAIWRAGAILFKDEQVGATAALYFNLTLVAAVGSTLMTPDNPLIVTTAFLLLALAKLCESQRGEWWLAIGVAFGMGMLSKYTTIFFAISILAWLLLVPKQRKWLFTGWPWIGGIIAALIFSPTIIWNAQHGWASVIYQSKRLIVHQWTFRLGELLAAQIGLATPPIFVLGCMALGAMFKGEGGTRDARVLVNAMIWPLAIYFIWHTFHGRVEGNWPEPIHVVLVIAAAVAVEKIEWRGSWAKIASWCQRLAPPVGLGMAAIIYLQASFGIIPIGRTDPTARALGAGWKELAVKIDQLRKELASPVVLTTDYGLDGWLSFYLPSHPPVVQVNERMRYVNAPTPDLALFRGPMVLICKSIACGEDARIHQRFASMDLTAKLARTRHGVPIQEYFVYKVTGPTGDPFEHHN